MKKTKARDINELISSKSVKHDTKVRLLEAEMLHRSHEIQSFDRLRYALTKDGEDHTAAFRRLSTARDQLIERLRILRGSPASVSGNDDARVSLDFPRAELVAPRLGHAGEGAFVFGAEGCVAVPRASEGISVVPSPSLTHGKIVTTLRGPLGNISFTAESPPGESIGLGLRELGTGVEHVWLHNWRYLVLFPCVSTASFLTYKFRVGVMAQLFSGAAQGLIMSFVSVGEAPSASPTSSIEVDTPVGWPLIADLEEHRSTYNGHYGYILDSLNVERTFAVGAGRTPAVAIIVGFVVRLTDGGINLRFMQESGIGIGQVCYRYTPIPVLAPA
jgi:hypothetical protein